ncbi:transporter substrate-binding domain-containing protein [Shewanella sp. 10N.286.51.B7]|uniref:diguanylate cyclase domain-containing protein n=1 Tax=Shewanella sp. 10N.286.51.B7 TaxID=1880836 RepID=UPI000C841C2C|nr:transporter substrate-binding domain-containing protein [Shewanella sp. 10N.286.51.B7]
MKLISTIFTFFLFTLMTFIVSADENESASVSSLAVPSSLAISMSEDAYPYQFVDDNGNPAGVMVDLWREWASATGVKVSFYPMQWQQSLQSVADGDVDAHIGMAITKERQQLFSYADKVSSLNSYLYLHKDIANKKAISDIRPFKIGIIEGTSHEQDLLAIEPSLTFKYFKTKKALYDAVVAGEIYVFATIQGYNQGIPINLELANNFHISSRILIKEIELAPVVSLLNQSWVSFINEGFKKVSTTHVDEIEKRWFGYRRESNGLLIAMQMNVEPFVDIGLDGLPHGLFVDLWRLWSEKTGISIDFIPSDMNGSIELIKDGHADVHIGYPESEEINTGLNRANHFYSVKSRFFSYNKEIKDISEIDGKRIGLFATSPYIIELRKVLPNAQIRYYDSMEQLIKASRDGDIAGFVAASAYTSHYLLHQKSWSEFYQYNKLDFGTQIYNLTNVEDTELAERIANGFQLISDFEMAKLEQKWLLNKADRTFSTVDKQIYISNKDRKYLDSLGAIKLGYLTQWAPMEYQNELGEFSGINKEVIEIVTEQLGIDIIPVAYQQWDKLNKDLQNGSIHLVGSMANNKNREPALEFTEGYWPSPWAIATTLTQQPLFNLSQYNGKRIGVVKGYNLINILRQQFPGLEIVQVDNTQRGLQAVSSGDVDLFIEQVVTLAYVLNEGEFPDLKMALVADLTEQKSHIGVYPKLKTIIPLLNRAIETIDETKQQQMYQKWVAVDLRSEADKYQKWFKIVLLGLLIISMITFIVFLGNKRLKREITLRKTAEQKIKFVAEHDPVTKLPNRGLLDDRLACAIKAHEREQAKFALLFIDLDKFKNVNDQHGHHIGDALLIHIATALKSVVRKSDTVSRFGGDEFVILLNKVDSSECAIKVADNIINVLSDPLIIEGITLTASASIGIAVYPDDGDDAIAILQMADKKMYKVKKQGGDQRSF